MDFELSDDEHALAEGMRHLCQGRFPLELLRAAEGQTLLDVDGWAELAHAGVFSLRLPEADGGLELPMATARAIAGAALDQFPDAPATAALLALAREVEAAPRLVVRAQPDLVERTQAALDQAAQACGFPGQIHCKADPALPRAAFVLDWGEGRAAFDPVEAEARAAAAIQTALIAEGLHAEPLLPPDSSSSGT